MRGHRGKSITASMVGGENRRDPEEEYFTLTVLACKMVLIQEEPDLMEVDINARKLYKMVKAEEIAFHHWHIWVKERINKLVKNYKIA
jgi:hypothetical protein